jgi:hypothetical protein
LSGCFANPREVVQRRLQSDYVKYVTMTESFIHNSVSVSDTLLYIVVSDPFSSADSVDSGLPNAEY